MPIGLSSDAAASPRGAFAPGRQLLLVGGENGGLWGGFKPRRMSANEAS